MKVAKAERPEFSMDLESMAEAICALSGEPSPPPSSSVAGVDTLRLPVLQPGARDNTFHPEEEEHCERTLVESSVAAPESKETKSQNSRVGGHPPATKSWSWTSLESHVSSGRPGASREKGK